MCQDKIFYDTCRKHTEVDRKWLESKCDRECPQICSENDSTELIVDDNEDNGAKFASEDFIATSTTQKANMKTTHKIPSKLKNSEMRRLINDLWRNYKLKHSFLKQPVHYRRNIK